MNTASCKIRVIDGHESGRIFALSSPKLILGRASSCDIVISDPALSRRQCCFEWRGQDLWLVDLASANQTLVNQQPIVEKALQPTDQITVGETVLQVIRGDATDDAATRIDLGFQPETEGAESRKKPVARSLLWAAVALLILISGVLLIFEPATTTRERAAATIPLAEKTRLLVQYEKVEAGPDGIFRYALQLQPDHRLTVTIDDLSANDRHLRKEKVVAGELIAEIINDINNSGFWELDKDYAGFAAQPNTLNTRTLSIALGSIVHTCRVSNREAPPIFKALCEKLETFSKNELGIWAIQFSSEKLVEMAHNALLVARKKDHERDVRVSNLFEARRNYHEALFYLDTINPKPDFYSEIVSEGQAVEAELEKRYQEQRFRADRAINLSEWRRAALELKRLCELIPDRLDARHQEAARKLMDVENRLLKERY